MDISKIIEYYNKYGKLYHEDRILNGRLFNEFTEMPVIKNLIADFKGEKTVLDIGCGSGIYSGFLAENNFKVTAIDGSHEMLSIAREYNSQRDIDFIEADFESYETSQQFGLILGSFILGYFEDLNYFFAKVHGILKNNGKLIVSSVHPVRMSAKERSFKGYQIEDYFESKVYESILIEGKPLLQIAKHTIQDITEAAYKNGFLTERIIEPVPVDEFRNHPTYSFFFKCPSIIIFQFIKLPT